MGAIHAISTTSTITILADCVSRVWPLWGPCIIHTVKEFVFCMHASGSVFVCEARE